MGRKEESRLTRKIMIGLASAMLGIMPLDIAGVDTGIAAAEEAAPDVRLPEKPSVAYVDEGGSVKVNAPLTAADGHAVMDIVQYGDKAIIDWNSFNVGKDATVNFIHLKNEGNAVALNTAGSTLNRVINNGPLSEIAGKINSVGTFILINPNGAVFTEGSEVNAAGIIVSTANITEDSYKSGNLWFDQTNTTNANIIMDGKMRAETGTGTDETANSGANKVKAHLDELKTQKINLENEIKNAEDTAAAAAQAKLDALKETAGDLITLNVSALKPATGFAVGANGIKLVADGDIFIGEKAVLNATAKTDISGETTVGTEEFEVDVGGTSRTGSIVLRADKNADDVAVDSTTGGYRAAKVYLNNENASQIQSQHIGIYYDADIVGDINGAKTDYSVSGDATQGTFTQKDYSKDYSKEKGQNYAAKVTTEGLVDESKGETHSTTFAMLVNDIYQLKAIDDSQYGNLSGSYALGTNIDAAETAKWNLTDGKYLGFDPIGTAEKPFTGSFTGSGGSNGYSISNLFINRPDENNVGLFAKVDGGSVWSLTLIDPSIKGNDSVGGAAGEGNNARFEGITIKKSTAVNAPTVNISGSNGVGGVVGSMVNSSIRSSVNEAVINGKTETGGIVGVAVGSRIVDGESVGYTIDRSKNKGNVTGSGDYTGGLVGLLEGKTGDEAIISESMNNGTISGQDYTGGIVGSMKGSGANTVSIKATYNTNEGTTLGTIVKEECTGTGTSDFGRVTGRENVGGLAGYMNNAEIETAYNAGNVTGDTNVGGVAGKMEKSSISKAYNADNNTVLMTAAANKDINSADNNAYYGFTAKNGDVYQYDQSKQQWIKNNDTENPLTTEKVLEEAPESVRTYNNRLAYRDAVVTGNKNVGGVVGDLEGGKISQVYNAGRVKAKDSTAVSNTMGDFGGIKNSGEVADSFYVTDRQDGTTKITNLGRAFGDASSDDASSDGITAKNLYEATNISSVTANGVGWTGTSNQNKDWMIYSNSATPLLKHFMKRININRQYEYDGTVHNLITTDVKDFYGGAFFGDGKGCNVTTDGVDKVSDYKSADWKVKSGTTNAADINGVSSKYTYENANMWSPQHGYFVDSNAAVIIVPRKLNVAVAGEKTYGQNAVSGAVIATTDDEAKNIRESGKYSMRLTGFAAGEDTDVLDIDSNSLSDVKYNKDENKLNAGTYKTDFTNPKITSKNNNYKIVTTDNLNVNPLKIDIEYTVSNKRKAYSDENPTMTGSDVTVKAGFVNGDSFDTSYSFKEIEENPEIGIYEGILDITGKDWQKAVGGNYVVDKVTAHKGTLTVYDPDAVVPSSSGSPLALPGVVPVSEDSAVVDGQGLDMPKEATAPRPVNDDSPNHPNVSFRPADKAEEQSDAKNDVIWKEVASDNSEENEEDGGEIERERRGSLRFLTIEDTGINVKPAVPSANIITVHASSRSDGGSTVVLESLRDEVRVLGTEPLLKGTTMDTLKDSAVIRYGAKRNKFKPIIEMSPAELSELLSTAFAEGEAAVVLSK